MGRLKPCPFCGGEPLLKCSTGPFETAYCLVRCKQCEVRTKEHHYAYWGGNPTREMAEFDATNTWNRRVS